MSVYLHVSFNFRHVSAARGPSSGKCFNYWGDHCTVHFRGFGHIVIFVVVSLLLEYCHSILLRLSQFFMPVFPVYVLCCSLPAKEYYDNKVRKSKAIPVTGREGP
jgi:hypothetical protein